MKTFLAVIRDIALLLSRVVLGGILVIRGWRTWMNDGLQAQTNQLIDAGAPQPELFSWALMLIELIGGVLLIVGLLTPVAALLVLAGSVALIIFVQFDNGVWIDNGGYEYVAVIGALSLIFLCFGGGRAALDRLFKRESYDDDVLAVDDNGPA